MIIFIVYRASLRIIIDNKSKIMYISLYRWVSFY